MVDMESLNPKSQQVNYAIPLLTTLIGVVVGILLQRYLVHLWPMIAIVVLCVGLLLMRRIRLLVLSVAILIGCGASWLSAPMQFLSPIAKDTHLCGVVAEAELSNDHQVAKIRIDSVCVGENYEPTNSFVIRARMPFFMPDLAPGDVVKFVGTYSLPIQETDLPLQDDMQGVYYAQGVSMLCYVPRDSLQVVGHSENPIYTIMGWRDDVVDVIFRSGLDEATASFMAAILTGDDSSVGQRDNYAIAGVAHLLALSGAHLAIIASILGFLFLPLAMAGWYRCRWIAVLVGVWLFVVMTGMSASVMRSAIMASAVIIAILMRRPRSSLNFLCLAAILILLFSPLSLYRVGFQLSFVATLSIILMANQLNPVSQRRRTLWRIMGVVMVTISATIGTMPLSAWHFHRLPWLFLPANIVAVAVLPIMICGGSLLTILTAMGVGASWLAEALNVLFGWFSWIVDAIATISIGNGLVWDEIYFSPWLLVPMYLAVALLFAWVIRRRAFYTVASTLTIALTVAAYFLTTPLLPANELFITRNLHNTFIVFRSGPNVTVVSNDRSINEAADSVQFVEINGAYLAAANVETIDFRLGELGANTGVIDFGGLTMKMANSPSAFHQHTDYCIANKAFKGDVVELAAMCNADTILLTADMNKRRRERYVRELSAEGVPHINLRDATFHRIPN